jgi:hypothetical protein
MENIQKLINAQDELIKVLKYQVIDLTLMSKIELGDDVTEKINSLQTEIAETKLKIWENQNF